MAYDGEELNVCMAKAFEFDKTTAVTVSGDTWNPCGHMILQVGAAAPYYFHVAGIRSRPKYMREDGFKRYLKEHKKRVLSRVAVPIKYPEKAQAKVDELMSKPWTWMVLPNNCAGFLESIVQAGGSSAGLYLNCPTLEKFR
ncbi:hypothetical protein SAMN05216359_101384 [Roseateles sp. YR242]|uniref:hypothetical protein n=1 Tax=Roseateles sp. YR242 TaxID=1855305 RepID=UPI0008CD19E5|nr:hypothetical protein [Roseateles sp. YR242]SEK31189.1 hypothetical protein SAMN05216359_101384 [Roseateles sp. YR242]